MTIQITYNLPEVQIGFEEYKDIDVEIVGEIEVSTLGDGRTEYDVIFESVYCEDEHESCAIEHFNKYHSILEPDICAAMIEEYRYYN